MSTYDDDDIEFDFFDEPETVEATQRRRLPRLEMPGGGRGGGERPPRPPLQTPTGLVPLARLVGLIAIAIAIVVGLVFWVGACQGKSKQGDYKSYADKVRAIATADTSLGKKFANEFAQPGLKESDLVSKLQDYAQQEQQAYQQAQQIRPPGPLRAIHQNLIDAIELAQERARRPRGRLGSGRRHHLEESDGDGRAADERGRAADRERHRLGAALQAARDADARRSGRQGRRHPEVAVRSQHRHRQRALRSPSSSRG